MRGSTILMLSLMALVVPGLEAQEPAEGGLEARVWLDRGDEPVLRRGETVRIFYRTTQNAYAAIFRIDTDGRISLIYPQNPTMEERLTGGVDYRLIFPNSPIWRVDDDPGVGYFFMVASPERLDFSAFPFDPELGWDLGAVGDVVYEDPYVAIDDYVALLIPNWEEVPYALDFITYNVGDTYTYPRFLCYDCHDARPYASWNPYAVPCPSYRVVIYDDPYFYPYYRYAGTSVVVARRVVTQPRYGVTVRAPGESFRPLVRTRPPPPRRTVAEFKEPAGTNASSVIPRRVQAIEREPSPRPTLRRRPSARLPVRTPPSGSGSSATRSGRSAPDATIVRPPTRPSGQTASPTRAPETRNRPSQRVTPRQGTPGSAGARPSTPSSRPGARPSAPSSRPTVRPSTPSSRPTTRPSTPGRGSARPAPSRPGTRPSTPSRPSARPRPQASPRSRPSSRPSRPSAPGRPSTGSSPPSRPSSSPRPTVRSRGNPNRR